MCLLLPLDWISLVVVPSIEVHPHFGRDPTKELHGAL